jgi:hypothetical protein
MNVKVTVTKNSRWRRGGARYDKKTQDDIDKKYHEQRGWWHGAKVLRK